MELRQLNYFLSAVTHLSFTKAAEECCIVQSAMSQQIRALEKELGVKLFDRTKHGLVLTPEGAALAQETHKLMDQVQAVQASVRLARERQAGVLRVGCEGDLLRLTLPGALRRLRGEYPGVRLELRHGRREALIEALQDEQLDGVILLLASESEVWEGLCCEIIQREAFYALLPRDHALAEYIQLPVQRLMEAPLIVYRDEAAIAAIKAALDDRVAASEPVCVDSQSTIESMVAAGYGVSLCAQSEMRPHAGIAYRELSGIAPARVGLLRRETIPADGCMRAFASFLQMGVSE